MHSAKSFAILAFLAILTFLAILAKVAIVTILPILAIIVILAIVAILSILAVLAFLATVAILTILAIFFSKPISFGVSTIVWKHSAFGDKVSIVLQTRRPATFGIICASTIYERCLFFFKHKVYLIKKIGFIVKF